MENAPEAPAEAPKAPESEATPTNSNETANQSPATQAPDMHGFTSEQLADMQKFFQANGGYDKVKSKISNPTPAPAEEQKPIEPAQPAQPAQPAYRIPDGSITQQEWMAREYFKSLASEEKYAAIANEIRGGDLLKEMAAFNISAMDENGFINDAMVRRYLDLKAQTVPAKQSSAMPEASAAPTVDYVPVGETINSLEEARSVIMQDSQLRSRGMAGHPAAQKAEEYLKNALSGGKK